MCSFYIVCDTQRTRTHAHTHTGILHMANNTTLEIETQSTCILVWAYIAALTGHLSNGCIARGLPNPRNTCSLVSRRRSFYAAGTDRQTHITCHSCKHNTTHANIACVVTPLSKWTCRGKCHIDMIYTSSVLIKYGCGARSNVRSTLPKCLLMFDKMINA